MKVLNRILGLTAVGIFCILISLQLINVDVRRDEMNTISSLAMNQTQTIMEEQITDEIYGTDNARKTISSNEEYFQEYLNNFQKLITTNCYYQVDLLDADYEKGLLDVNVTCRYRNLVGEEKSMSVRKTSIIEAVDKTGETVEIPTYAITYDLQNGRVIGKNPTSYNDESVGTVKLINPIRTGYKFIGWTGSNGDVPQLDVTIDYSVKEPLHYVANWEMLTYNILYDMNDSDDDYKAVNSEDNPKFYTIETETFTLVNPTRPYYDFLGWTGSNGKTPSTKVTVTRGHYGDRIYTANWTLHKYGINYNLNGGVNNASNPANYTVKDGEITLKDPTRYGYNFLGWYEDAAFTKQITTIDSSRAENITLYAKWTPKVANITFNSNNGSGETTTVSYTVGKIDQRLVFPGWTKTGYNASGYTDGTNTFGLTDQVTTEWIINHEGTHTLDVIWSAKQVNVTFYHNDGSGKSTTKTYYYDEIDQTFPDVDDWVRTNYTAQYYAYTSNGTQAYAMNNEVSNSWIIANEGNVNLYVIWKVNILYGYQTATGYSGTLTTSPPANGFYKTGSTNQNVSFAIGSTQNADGRFTYSGGAFVPTSVNVGGWCHTGECYTMYLQGANNNGGWTNLCSYYQSRGGGGSCNVSTSVSYNQYHLYCASRGSVGYQQWGTNSCIGTASGWMGYQIGEFTVSGYIVKNGYYAVTSWSDTTQMPNYNSYTKTNTRRLVYSRNGGITWTECDDYGSSCPVE